MKAPSSSHQNELKRLVAARAVEAVEDGMVVGLGSGSTAALAVEKLAERVAGGLRMVGIPTSRQTAELARRLGVPLTGFDKHRQIDLTIDGADQVELGSLNLIKGLGGALLHEKIVAAASKRMIVVVDESKLVGRLGRQTPLPVEILSFGWQTIMERLDRAGFRPVLRLAGDKPFVTDSGNLTADCLIADIADAAALQSRLATITGVVDSGLFIGLATQVMVGRAGGVEAINR